MDIWTCFPFFSHAGLVASTWSIQVICGEWPPLVHQWVPSFCYSSTCVLHSVRFIMSYNKKDLRFSIQIQHRYIFFKRLFQCNVSDIYCRSKVQSWPGKAFRKACFAEGYNVYRGTKVESKVQTHIWSFSSPLSTVWIIQPTFIVKWVTDGQTDRHGDIAIVMLVQYRAKLMIKYYEICSKRHKSSRVIYIITVLCKTVLK